MLLENNTSLISTAVLVMRFSLVEIYSRASRHPIASKSLGILRDLIEEDLDADTLAWNVRFIFL